MRGEGPAKRRGPSGGWAKGMPRYSETAGFQSADWPVMKPVVVFTSWPICHVWLAARVARLVRARKNCIVVDLVSQDSSIAAARA